MIRREFLRNAVGSALGAGLASSGAGATGPEGEVEREELDTPSGTATIKTDEYGVSHIYADDLETLSYANGYVQARDRLFQMDALRHIGYGDSASILGEEQLHSDVQVTRDLYTREEIRAQYEAAPEEYRRALDAFAEGVNRKIEEYRDANELPAEFTLLAHHPEPWSPEDSVAIMSYLMGVFGVMGGHELGNARTLAQLFESMDDERRAYEAYGDLNWLEVTEEHTTSIDPDELTVDAGEAVPDYGEVPDDQLEYAMAATDTEPWGIDRASCEFHEALIGGCHDSSPRGRLEGLKWGSNALAVGGEHTETGEPMLFGGPQMGYFKPPVIYEVGLHGAGFDVAGVEVVGSPGVVVGRTPDFAWTVTSGHDDQTDTIAVDLHPDDRYRYEWDGEYHEFETFTVTHETTSVPEFVDGITDGDWDVTEVEQEVARIREDGEVMPVIAYNDEENVAYAQRVTTRGEELEGAWMWMQVGRKEDLQGVREAIDDFPFTFNFLYADREDVAMIHTCKVPERNPELDHRLPEPADRHEWRDMLVGREAGIEVVDPDRGYLVNWNNAPVVGWTAGDREQQWGSHHRVDLLVRGVELALADGPLSVGDVAGILRYVATHDVNAPASAPAFIEAGRGADDDTLGAMADELQAWADDDNAWVEADGDGRYDHAGLAIWEETRKILQDEAFREELGNQAPGLAFDPQNSGDPHAGSHGNTFNEVTFVDALAGETTYDWLGVDDAETAGDAEAASDATADCAGKSTTVQGRVDESGGLRTHTHEVESSEGCGLSVSLSGPADADLDLYLTLDGREPSTSDYDRLSSSAGGGETITVDADELDPGTTVGVLVRAYRGAGEYTLTFGRGDSAASDEVVRAALREAGDRLADRFGDDDPAAWQRSIHRSKFTAIGIVETEKIPMVNRGTWNHVVAMGEGLDGAMGVLPPSNSGHITFWEKVGSVFGGEPARLDDQLGMYRDFEYRPLPVTPEEVDRVTGRSRTLSR